MTEGEAQEEGLGALPPARMQGAEPPLEGKAPQSLKPKNGLDASRKAFGDVERTLNLCIILVLVGMLQPVCRPLNLLEYKPKTEYHTGNGKIITSLLLFYFTRQTSMFNVQIRGSHAAQRLRPQGGPISHPLKELKLMGIIVIF